MEFPPGQHQSYWVATTPTTAYPPLPGDRSADVAVIGGGIVGLTLALLLRRAGRQVVVLESRRIAEQVSGCTTAKITSQHGLIYSTLLKRFGLGPARMYAHANQTAMERIFRFVEEYRIDCDLERRAAYTYSESGQALPAVYAEVDAAQRLGLPARFVRRTPLPFPIAGGICFDDQAQFHPRKYLLALAARIGGEGSAVYEHSRVLDVTPGESLRVVTERGTLDANEVVVATNLPILDRGGFFAKAFARRHLLLAAPIAAQDAPDGMFLSIEMPSYSLRTVREAGGVLLLVTGHGFKPGHGDTRAMLQELEAFLRAYFPVGPVRYWWGNQDYDSMDRVPYVGQLTSTSRHLYVATGFGAWGMTGGTAAAMVLADRILGRSNPWLELYDATRVNPRVSARTFVNQNLYVAREWVSDRLTPARVGSLDRLARDEGAIVKWRGERLAAYRDQEGVLHALSPGCTHMGCIVAWNAAERSWDCPCHGSRFSYRGEVLQGPAVKDLERRTIP